MATDLLLAVVPSTSNDVAIAEPLPKIESISPALPAAAAASSAPSRLRQSTISQQHSPLATASPRLSQSASGLPKAAQIGNQAVHKLPLVEFLNPETKSRIQPDDLADPLLMACCTALACVGNRALCPKEIADVCIKNGWNCTGSQPFAIVSTCIRQHLRRRGILTNHSNGRAVNATSAPPLFASYELTGPVQPVDTLAMGIEAEAKLAVKRGTLWYLSEDATGIPSPFGLRDPNLPQNQTAEAIAARQSKPSVRRTSLPASVSMPILTISHKDKSQSPEEELGPDGEALGRGKRKRKASGIAGADSDWHSGDKRGSSLDTVPERAIPPSHRRAGSIDSTFRYPPPAAPAPMPMALLDRVSGIKRIKLRLGNTNSPTSGSFDSTITESESETNDTSSFAAAQERRRMKKRSKSDGSLLLLEPSAMHFRPPSASSLSPQDALDGHVRAKSAEPPTTLTLETLSSRRMLREDAEMRSVIAEVDDEADDDFHEAMLKGDLDFDFEAMGRLPSALDAIPDEEFVLLYEDTPATTPGSPEIEPVEDLYDLANEAANASLPEGGEELILLGLDECKAAETLAEEADPTAASSDEVDATPDGLLSPAPPLPALPILTAANTIGFAPAGGAQDLDDTDDPVSLASSFSDFGHLHHMRRSSSPESSLDSSYSATPDSEMQSGAPSPDACSVDSFDAEVVIGAVQRRLSEELDVNSPLELQAEDLITAEEAQGEEDLRISGQDLAIDELDLEFGDTDGACGENSTPPPTPFGPELYGFVKTPCLNWQPAPSVDPPLCEEAQKDLSLELVSEDVEMDSQATVKTQPASTPAEVIKMITVPLKDSPPAKPVLQRKTSNEVKVVKTEVKAAKPKAPRKSVAKVASTAEVDPANAEPKKAVVTRRSTRKATK